MSKSLQEQFKRAQTFIDNKNYTQAIILLDEIRDRDRNAVRPWLMLYDVLVKEGLYIQADALIDNVREQFGGNVPDELLEAINNTNAPRPEAVVTTAQYNQA